VLPQMSASELCVAISIDFDDNRTSLDSIPSVDEIMIHSSSFLRCDNNYVEFAHFTVEEYLRSIDTQGKPRLARYRCDEHSANAYAVETCLTFLNLDDFRPNLCANLGTLQQLLETHPFYIRASLAWNICSASSRSSERALRSVDKLFSSPNVSNYDNWLQVRLLASRFEIGNDVVGMEPHSSGHSLRCTGIDSSFLTRSIAVASSTSKIHVAAMFHLVDQIPRLFKTETQLNALSPLGTTLHCALYGEWAMSFRMQVDDMTRTRPGAHAETLFPTISLLVKLGADARIPFSTRGKIVTTLYLATWVSATQRILDAGAIPDESTARAIIHDLGGGFIDLDTEPLAKFPLESVNVRDRHYVGQLMMKLDWDSAVVTSNTTLLKQVTIFDLEETLRDSCEYNELSIFRQIFEVRNLDVNHRFRRDGASFLHVACGGSAADVVAYLIEQCADVNSRGPDGSSPLKYYFASDFWWNTHMHLNGHFPKQDCLATFHSMVANKANLHRLTDNCESALMMWAQCDMLQLDVLEELLRVLLKQDIDIKSRNASGQNVWHHLAYRNSLKLSQMLKSAMDPVSLRSVLDVADESGITPLLAAITAGQLVMFEFLVEHGCDVTSKTAKGESILHLAASGIWSDGDTFQMLLTKYLHSGVATSTFNGATIAHYCVISIAKGVHVGASTEMPRRFRESMAALKASSISITDTNCDGETPLDVMCQWVAEEGHHSGPICSDCNAFLVCFELLVTHNHAKDEQMQAAVTWAILIRALKAAAYSLDSTDYNYPVDTVCSRAICIAIDRGLRLDYLDGAELDLDSIFDIAARLRQESLLLKLLDTASIDFERPSRYKPHHTPLQSLCAHCCPVSTIRAATSRTKNIRAGDSQGLGPLHLLFSNDEAQHSNMAPVIHALLDAGVDPNEQTSRTGRTALMMAAGLDNISIDAFGTLVRSGAKVDVVDVRGCNALFYACNSGTEYAINALIAAGSASLHAEAEFFDFPKREILLCSPVHLAARRGMPGIVQTLLELERSVEGSDADDRSPSPLLMVENKETVRLLLDHGYDPNLLDASLGMTPLHVASWAGNVQIVHALLQAGCDKEALSHNGLSAWMFAIMKGHTRIAETLESFNNNSSGQTVATIPLLPPAENRKPKSAATDDSKDPSSRSVTSYAILRPPLGRVIVRRNLQDGIWQHLVKSPLQVIEKLVMGGLDMGLRFNSCTCTPMLVAVAYDRVNVVTYLVSIGVPLLTEDKCPLHLQREDTVAGLLAAAPIWTRLVEQWLHRPEWRTQMRQKLLVCMIASAIEYGNPDTLDILLSKIPGPFFSRDLIDCVGWVPFISPSEFLHQAAASSKASAISCATMLLSHGVDVDSLDRFGRTPLHLAALCGHLDMAILLVAHNAEVNYTYPSGGTALSIAAEAGHLSMVKYLLASSAHQNLCSSPILAPLASAATQGHYPIFRALLEAGATANTWDYYVLCHAGYRSALMLDERYFCATQGPDPFHYDFLPQKTALPILRSIPSARRALFLATLDIRYDTTALYSVALDGIGRWVEFAIRYGAAINMEGGLQGTPLMAACHAGHLPIVKQLVRSGALLAYWNGSSYVSSLVGAQSHPKIIRWLLVGRFTETLRLTGTSTGGDLGLVDVAEDLYCGDANAPNVELILKHEIKGYLEDNFWFVPPRRFVDNGGGCFDAVAILPSEFAKYKPTYI
jgi:ankyrin repeat protein